MFSSLPINRPWCAHVKLVLSSGIAGLDIAWVFCSIKKKKVKTEQKQEFFAYLITRSHGETKQEGSLLLIRFLGESNEEV